MLMTTTSAVEGRPASRYLGVVTGEAIIGANVFRDMFAAVRDVVGGRSATYERGLAEAREIAMSEMQKKAQDLGATAVNRHRSRLRSPWPEQRHADGLGQRNRCGLLTASRRVQACSSSIKRSDLHP